MLKIKIHNLLTLNSLTYSKTLVFQSLYLVLDKNSQFEKNLFDKTFYVSKCLNKVFWHLKLVNSFLHLSTNSQLLTKFYESTDKGSCLLNFSFEGRFLNIKYLSQLPMLIKYYCTNYKFFINLTLDFFKYVKVLYIPLTLKWKNLLSYVKNVKTSKK